jgi:hypothetical protein
MRHGRRSRHVESALARALERLARLALVKDRGALRSELTALADTPDLVRLIVSHEKVARGSEAAAALPQAITYL